MADFGQRIRAFSGRNAHGSCLRGHAMPADMGARRRHGGRQSMERVLSTARRVLGSAVVSRKWDNVPGEATMRLAAHNMLCASWRGAGMWRSAGRPGGSHAPPRARQSRKAAHGRLLRAGYLFARLAPRGRGARAGGSVPASAAIAHASASLALARPPATPLLSPSASAASSRVLSLSS